MLIKDAAPVDLQVLQSLGVGDLVLNEQVLVVWSFFIYLFDDAVKQLQCSMHILAASASSLLVQDQTT